MTTTTTKRRALPATERNKDRRVSAIKRAEKFADALISSRRMKASDKKAYVDQFRLKRDRTLDSFPEEPEE